ncbi:MAG: NAD(P)H-hydrate epimerase [Parcubacteria group bacterium CG08_land_8_20_14_0_20_48_21]|nr:MAG: NAD(P)H-hydrate epimerase [Parcubacteria group bacterium CG08_land_8_20_14_0_20_48_21]PIY78201.1 MAG: NAD(P)H-hydrate epimerase [Parcubacteria group bacterium CG_4_10_14_0_8_um_filter_48_154]PIZ78047.1 MAG: NAD(P)H-hydrate epimerase [bacterium CG_4_10_14_0_2_um_filter_48_144]PJC40085.1 MAG: NAD(P)H-hydrate epimerase [Parcubacteria group bacterium CG_4_9_14_0_2_um_filter_48_40]
MLQTVTTEQMREIDRLMTEEFGVSLLQTSTIAGLHVAKVTRDYMSGVARDKKVVICAGKGHNGSVGLVVARNLVNWGAKVSVYITSPKEELGPESQQHWYALEKAGVLPLIVTDEVAIETRDADCIVDALLGYGMEGNPRGTVAHIIDHINRSAKKIISIDLPSGLDSTTGVIYAPCVVAKATVALGLPKAGLAKPESKQVMGELFVADIGIPQTLYQKMNIEVGPVFTQDEVLEVKIKVVKVRT